MRAEELAAGDRPHQALLLPLVTCIFPAIVMVVLGPAIIRLLRMVLPMIAGSAQGAARPRQTLAEWFKPGSLR